MSIHGPTGEMLVSLVLDTMVCTVIITRQNSYALLSKSFKLS